MESGGRSRRRSGGQQFSAPSQSNRSSERILCPLLVTPQVLSGFINPNDPVKRVDLGQTTVNLGHHLENITNHP
jgi:hypothetical protein